MNGAVGISYIDQMTSSRRCDQTSKHVFFFKNGKQKKRYQGKLKDRLRNNIYVACELDQSRLRYNYYVADITLNVAPWEGLNRDLKSAVH